MKEIRAHVGLLALLLQGCSFSSMVERAAGVSPSTYSLGNVESAVGVSPSMQGELLFRGDPSGEIPLRPESCLSGDRANFRGVDLLTPQLVLRIVAEPIEGLAMALIDSESGERRGIFRRSDCAVLRGDIQRTGWRVNDIADVSGFLEAQCRLASGEELSGSITFEHCH